jgi:hypothetical protein
MGLCDFSCPCRASPTSKYITWDSCYMQIPAQKCLSLGPDWCCCPSKQPQRCKAWGNCVSLFYSPGCPTMDAAPATWHFLLRLGHPRASLSCLTFKGSKRDFLGGWYCPHSQDCSTSVFCRSYRWSPTYDGSTYMFWTLRWCESNRFSRNGSPNFEFGSFFRLGPLLWCWVSHSSQSVPWSLGQTANALQWTTLLY